MNGVFIMSATIYIAEDDQSIREVLVSFLTAAHYHVQAFTNGDDLWQAFQRQTCDLVILDIMMPGTDGLTICERIRDKSTVPIIILTAKESELDFVRGITLGSDDYLTKPFRPTILLMRVKALLRRVEMEQAASKQTRLAQSIQTFDLIYDAEAMVVLCQQQPITLTMTELQVLVYFMQHANKAIHRETLLQEVWGFTAEVETRVTDETIRRIRKKLLAVNSTTSISSIWGFGYKLIARGSEA